MQNLLTFKSKSLFRKLFQLFENKTDTLHFHLHTSFPTETYSKDVLIIYSQLFTILFTIQFKYISLLELPVINKLKQFFAYTVDCQNKTDQNKTHLRISAINWVGLILAVDCSTVAVLSADISCLQSLNVPLKLFLEIFENTSLIKNDDICFRTNTKGTYRQDL